MQVPLADPGRALAGLRALVAAGGRGQEEDSALLELEARLKEVLLDVTDLDLELEELSGALLEFSRSLEVQLGPSFAARSVAERLLTRLLRLDDGLSAEALRLEKTPGVSASRRGRGGGAASSSRRARSRWKAGPPPPAEDEEEVSGAADSASGEAEPSAPPEVEAAEVALKRIYRRLARLLHPDLAQGEEEAKRLSGQMAQVNAAYARGDLTELSVLAERLGAGEPLGELSKEERRAHLEKRIATLERILASLERERSRLQGSDTERLRAEADCRAKTGGDSVAETKAELLEETQAAYAEALHRLARLGRTARALGRVRKVRMGEIEKRGPTGARRAFDPLAESQLVRQGVVRLEERRATKAARELARALEDLASAQPWEVGLTLLAFFAEVAGGRPPESISTAEGLAATWDVLRAEWPGSPDLARALGRLPRHLVLGARSQGGEVWAGLQLATADLSAGVSIAMVRPAVLPLASKVLSGLGPREKCKGCGGEEPALHLYRTRVSTPCTAWCAVAAERCCEATGGTARWTARRRSRPTHGRSGSWRR